MINMPISEQPLKGQQIIVDEILANPRRNILDVGAGEGRWSKLLFDKVKKLDAVEIWKPYISKYSLKSKYRVVYCKPVQKMNTSKYDVIILGDVLEHINYDEAIQLLNSIPIDTIIYLSAPVSSCPQGKVNGNIFETHVYQWTTKELVELGFRKLHIAPNKKLAVAIGTYKRDAQTINDTSSVDFKFVELFCRVISFFRYSASGKKLRLIIKKRRTIDKYINM